MGGGASRQAEKPPVDVAPEIGGGASRQAEEPAVYVYSGHGVDTIGSLKDVPPGCKYINMGTCGLLNRVRINEILPSLKNPKDDRFVTINVPQIEELLDGLSIRIYTPTPPSDKYRYVNNTFFPIGVYPNKDGTFDLYPSGLIQRQKSFIGNVTRHNNLKTVSLDILKSLFSMSVYPTIEEVDAQIKKKCGDRLEALTYADLAQASNALALSVETLMERFPGIHYNFLCRSDVTGNVNLPAYRSILRRQNSAEAGRRPENAIRQGYREHYALLNLLETALLFEGRRIHLNSERLTRISKTPIYKIVPGDDSVLKTSLVTHLITGPASRWNPPELTQSIKNSLLSTAIEKGYEHSIRFLMKLGAECSREQLLGRVQKTIHRRDVPATLAILQEEWVGATLRNDVFITACSTNFTELAKEMLATKLVDVNAVNANGTTALIQACASSSAEIAELLLREPGIDVNKQNNNGWTALSYCHSSRMSAVRARLLELGARDFKEEERAAAGGAGGGGKRKSRSTRRNSRSTRRKSA